MEGEGSIVEGGREKDYGGDGNDDEADYCFLVVLAWGLWVWSWFRLGFPRRHGLTRGTPCLFFLLCSPYPYPLSERFSRRKGRFSGFFGRFSSGFKALGHVLGFGSPLRNGLDPKGYAPDGKSRV